ncbi:MAG: hypothetical protein IKF50_06520 [Clostridia bacterium]|nr:hypothetical protein [Clostridia bacterium]
MNRRTQKRTLSFKPRFFVVLGVILALAAALVFLFAGNRYTQVVSDTCIQEIRADAVLLRDERVIATEQHGEVTWLVKEGTFVSEGETVARVIQSQYSGDLVKDLQKIQDEILRYQRERLTDQYHDAELEEMDEEIIQSTLGAVRAIRGKSAVDLVQWQSDLETYMTRREEYLKQNYASDDRLSDLLEESESLRGRIASLITEAYAPSDGRISFNIDGCESELNAGAIRVLSADMIQQTLNAAEAEKVTKTTQFNMIFRCIGCEEWYCAVPTEEQIQMPMDGIFVLTIDELPGKTYQAEVIDREMLAQGGVLLLRINGDPEEVINLRRVKVTLRAEYSGMYVPERALRKKDGNVGVWVRNDERSKIFVPVDVYYRQGSRVLIGSDRIKEGDTIKN